MKRALVTGASGFLGRQVAAALLDKGYEVHACARKTTDQRGVNFHSVDLLNQDQAKAALAFIRPSHLINMAWDVGDTYWTSPTNIDWASASLSLLRAFHLAGGLRFIGAGTSAEYSWNYPSRFIKETDARQPTTFYGVAKENTRRLTQAYCETVGLSHAWGVLFMSYGAFERPNRLIPSVICNLLEGRKAEVTTGVQIRDFMDSRDVGFAIGALADSECIGSVNIASGRPIAIKDIIDKIGYLIGRADLIKIGALPNRPNEPERIVADVTRLTREVLFEPRIEIDQGLSDTIDWWRHYLDNA